MCQFVGHISRIQNLLFLEKRLLNIHVHKQPPEMFYKKAVLKNFAIFTVKHLCWCFFLIKLQAYWAFARIYFYMKISGCNKKKFRIIFFGFLELDILLRLLIEVWRMDKLSSFWCLYC